MRNSGKRAPARRSRGREKWVTNINMWNQASNLALGDVLLDVFSYKPTATGMNPDVTANAARGLPVSDRYVVSGWIDVFTGVGPSLGNAAELGAVTCGLYKAAWDDATAGFATQDPRIIQDACRNNWLYLNAKGYNIGWQNGTYMFVKAPEFRFAIPQTVIEEGDALALCVSTWLSVPGTSTTLLCCVVNARIKVLTIT